MPKIDPQTGEVVPDVTQGSNQSSPQIDPTTGEVIPPTPKPPSMLQQAGSAAKNFGIGALKGAGSTANNIGHLLYPDVLAKHLTGAPSPEQQEGYFAPQGTAQTLGKGAEQAAEFMVPGGAEEAGAGKIASLLPKAGKAIPRLLTSAAGAGLVNKAQGGSLLGGAAAGAAGAGIGEGMRAAAPLVAESALGIPKAARAFGKTPGKAILEETRGIRPDTIAQSAQERMNQLTPELESKAAASPNLVSLKPAREHIAAQMGKAEGENTEGIHNQLNRMGNTLAERFWTKQAIPEEISAADALSLKRGFGKEHTTWNPETHSSVLLTGRHAYGLLDKGIDQAVPEGAELNQRISSLIPVARRAESVSRNPPAIQRALGRFGAHTGALTMGGLGAGAGYKEGGLPGAVAGGVTGVLAPELIASPEGQMAAARLLGKANTLRPATGLLLQGTRGNQ